MLILPLTNILISASQTAYLFIFIELLYFWTKLVSIIFTILFAFVWVYLFLENEGKLLYYNKSISWWHFFLCFVKWKMSIWHLFDGIACSVEYQMCFIYLIFVFEQNFYYKNVILNFVVIYNATVHGLRVHIQQECVWIKYGSLIFCYVEHLFFFTW